MSAADATVPSPDPVSSPTNSRLKRRRRRTRIGRARDFAKEHGVLSLSIALTVIVATSFLAVGAVHVATLLVVSPVAILAGCFAIWIEDPPRRRVSAPALVLLGLSVYSLLQSLPLPLSWLQHLSPVAAQTWTDAFKLAGTTTRKWASLSVDPGGSRVEALKWLTYACAFTAAARLGRERGSLRGLSIIVASALLGGILCVAHGLSGLEEWMGLYKPQYARPPWAPAPLLNPNNFAGYLNLALFSAMGLLFARKFIVPRWVSGFAIVLLAALVILTGSRGGVLSLLVGFLVAGTAFRSQQKRAERRGKGVLPAWLPLTALAIGALSLAAIGSTDLVWQQLLDETTGKLRIIEYSQAIIRDHLWLGIGRGSFGTAFAAYRQVAGDSIAEYAENFVVQWLVEWGLPVSLAAVAALTYFLWPGRHDFAKNAPQTGAYIGVFVLLFQNLTDLATEVASVGIALFVLLGTVHGTTQFLAERRHRLPASERSNHSPRSLHATLATAGLLAVAIPTHLAVLLTGRPDAVQQRLDLAATLTSVVGKKKGDPAFSVAAAHVQTALLRTPADPYVPVVGALLTRESGKSPFPWLNQALRRDPLNAKAHLLLAETLEARGKTNQALMELQASAKLSPALINEVADRAVRWATDLDQLLKVVPAGTDGIPVLNALAARHAGSAAKVKRREDLLGLSLGRDNNSTTTNSLVADNLLAALIGKDEVCSGGAKASCEERLKKHAAVVLKDPSQPQLALMLRAQLLAYELKYDEAESLLKERCATVPDPAYCSWQRVNYANKLPDHARFEAAVATYTALACSTPASCSAAYTWVGNLELQRNRPLVALSRFERAAEEQPTSAGWLRVAEIALNHGRASQAELALRAAKRLDGNVPAPDLDKRLLEMQRARMMDQLSR